MESLTSNACAFIAAVQKRDFQLCICSFVSRTKDSYSIPAKFCLNEYHLNILNDYKFKFLNVIDFTVNCLRDSAQMDSCFSWSIVDSLISSTTPIYLLWQWIIKNNVPSSSGVFSLAVFFLNSSYPKDECGIPELLKN